MKGDHHGLKHPRLFPRLLSLINLVPERLVLFKGRTGSGTLAWAIWEFKLGLFTHSFMMGSRWQKGDWGSWFRSPHPLIS